jgi:hypothetical protein
MKNIRILAGMLACVGSMSATALQTPEWPYGFNEGDLKEEAVLPTANRQNGGLDDYENATNLSFLHFYVFPFLLGMTQEIEGQICSGGAIIEAPAIPENHRTFFEKLKGFERDLVVAINGLNPQPLPAKSPQDLNSFRRDCDKIADALPFPQNIRDYTKSMIKDAADGDRVCIAFINSPKIEEFQTKYNLLPYTWGYSSLGTIDAVSGETVSYAVSVAVHESGHAAAYRFFNCANVDEVFSMFFQVAAFSTAVNIRKLTKPQAERIVREFLRCMFAEVGIVNLNKEICEGDLFREETALDLYQYDNLLRRAITNLTDREKSDLSNSAFLAMRRFWGYSPNTGHYGFSLICALTEYIDFEEKLQSTPPDQREQLFYYHLTRLRLLFKKPILWKAYFLEGDKVKKAIEYLQRKILQAGK